MAVKPMLERLLRLRELEEEQSRLELERASTVHARVEQQRNSVARRQAVMRRAFVAGIEAGNNLGRSGAVIEMERAREQTAQIELRLAAAERELRRQREEFLVRRTSRRQVETLVDEAKAELELMASRRAQQMLDDWYGRRRGKC